MNDDAGSKRTLHPAILWLVLALTVGAASWQISKLLDNADFLPVHDFCEYWAAGRLNLQGYNPYDPAHLFLVQKKLGLIFDEPIMMWNPPWTLSLAMPLGALPFRASQLLFLLLQIAAVVLAADWMWQLYGGPPSQRWFAWLLAGTFLPALFMIKGGQISGFLLLGAAGFLYFEGRGQLFLAGAAAALMGIKPQLFYLFWVGLLLWSIRERRWQVIAGGLTAGLIASIPPLLYNPAVFGQYAEAVSNYAPTRFISLTLGTLLRLAWGEPYANLRFEGTYFWLQYVPPLFGLMWLGGYWWARRQNWRWREELPLLLPISIFTSMYGAWPSDLVLLVISVVQAAVWLLHRPSARWLGVGVHLGINGLALMLSLLDCTAIWFIWMAPALLFGWLLIRQRVGADRGLASV